MRHVVATEFGNHVIEVRFVIRNVDGRFFTEMKESGKRDVVANAAVVATELLYTPQFDASRSDQASQFDTQRDAEIVMEDSRFGGSSGAFKGCIIVTSTTET